MLMFIGQLHYYNQFGATRYIYAPQFTGYLNLQQMKSSNIRLLESVAKLQYKK